MNESEYIKCVALDAEMTPTIVPGESHIPEPTQVAITDINGNVLFNEYFKLKYPPRIPMSKVRRKKLQANARRTYDDEARNDVLSILRGKIVVGHDLIHDFRALRIDPNRDGLAGVIDSVKLPIFKKLDPDVLRPRALKNLTSEFLHRRIQEGVIHNALEDSKASANLIRTTLPYLNAPMPVTREMVDKSKIIINYGQQMGLNVPAPTPTPTPVNTLLLAARRIAEASGSAETGARAPAISSANMPNLLQFEHPGKSAENYLKEMEGLNMRKTVKSAKNYLREMEGLNMRKNHFAEFMNGHNNRKRVNHRKTRNKKITQ